MSRGHRARTSILAPALALVLAAGLVGCSKTESATPTVTGIKSTGTTGKVDASAFALTKDQGAAIKAAGLPALATEGRVVHYHSHLDVMVNNEPVTVPENIGIDVTNRGISPLHTHTPDGIVHIEAEDEDVFTVGQLFTEWGVKLDKSCMATYCTDDKNQLLAFVNGQPAAEASSIPFRSHDEIVVWFGPKGSNPDVPKSYEFEDGQ